MATSKKSTGKKLKDPMSSVGATPVNLLVRLANGEEKKIRATCGLGLEKPLANYDPDTQSWKMFGDISLWGDSRLLLNLPPSGMTQNGVLFLQPAWEPITGETESLLWPTPRANTAMSATITPESAHNPKRFPNLETVVGRRQWPTPTTQDHIERKSTQQKEGSMHSVGLGDAVRMWPTPTAVSRPMEGNVRLYRAKVEAGEMTEAEAEAILGKSVWEAQGKLPATWPTPTTADTFTPKSRKNPTLGDAARASSYPTPTHGKMAGGTGAFNKVQELFTQGQITDEERKSMQAGNGGKLNPTWVEWLMGFPLGWTDLED